MLNGNINLLKNFKTIKETPKLEKLGDKLDGENFFKSCLSSNPDFNETDEKVVEKTNETIKKPTGTKTPKQRLVQIVKKIIRNNRIEKTNNVI